MHHLRVFCLALLVAVPACARGPEEAQTGAAEQAAAPAAKPTIATTPRVTGAALWQAIVKADSATVAAGLSQGIDANLVTSEGVSALMLAASTGNDGAVKALLSHGARPNESTTEHHLTPLMFAANACSRAVADLLVGAQADATLKDSDGGSAADWAFRGCDDPKDAARLMEYLHENGASVQPRGDAVGLLLAEAAPPPMEAILEAARSKSPSP
jgi:ankyrin repeat protein